MSMALRSRFFAFILIVIYAGCLTTRVSALQLNANVLGPSAESTEDFTSAALSKSHLVADPPQLLEKAEIKGFTREFLAVEWRPVDRIYLFVVRPAKLAKPPVVIYSYGHPSDTDRFMDDGWCERVTDGGYAAVGFVPALTGQRYHDRAMKEWFVSELQESLAKSSHDVQMILNYLAERGDVDMNNVGLFGTGASGTIAVMAASADSRIKALDLLDPWGDWPDWVKKTTVIPDDERSKYDTAAFLKKVAGFDPVKLLPTLKTQHIRLMQLDEDNGSNPDDSKKRIEAALPPGAEHRRYANSQAFFTEAASGGRVFDWLKAQLKPPTPKTSQAAEKTKDLAGDLAK